MHPPVHSNCAWSLIIKTDNALLCLNSVNYLSRIYKINCRGSSHNANPSDTERCTLKKNQVGNTQRKSNLVSFYPKLLATFLDMRIYNDGRMPVVLSIHARNAVSN